MAQVGLPPTTSLDELDDLTTTALGVGATLSRNAFSENGARDNNEESHTNGGALNRSQNKNSPNNNGDNNLGLLPPDVELSKFRGGTVRRKKKLEVADSQQTVSPDSDELQSWQENYGKTGFCIGFAEDKNKRYRRTMEDAHAFFYDFNGVSGQGMSVPAVSAGCYWLLLLVISGYRLSL